SFWIVKPPVPSHTLILQSPGLWFAIGVPRGGSIAPHTPATHVRMWHSVSLPGHSDAMMQFTQWPAPSHSRPVPHVVPAATTACDATPFVQMSVVHGVVSFGRPVSWTIGCDAPMPSHT